MSKVRMPKETAKKPKQTYFNINWLNEFEWVEKGSSNILFGCKWCNKSDLKLLNMGKGALTKHVSTGMHERTEQHQNAIKNFFKKHVSSASSTLSASQESSGASSSSSPSQSQELSAPSTSSTPSLSQEIVSLPSASSVPVLEVVPSASLSNALVIDVDSKEPTRGMLQATIQHGVFTSQVFKAEIIWCFRTVMKDSSNSSNEDISLTFRSMFPDDKVVGYFTCGKDKTKYLVNHGIAPWIKELLFVEVDKATFVVIGFDESLNKATQTCQMDLNVRYWDPVDHRVKTRYWDSKFLGHTANTDILSSFNESTIRIESSKIIQVSMDGPSVNHLFYEKLVQHRADVQIAQLMVSIGSCGLHIIHGAFKFAFQKTSWGMKGIIKGTFVILHDTPARRADYISVTKSDSFPLFFCATRWVEDKGPADRLIEIWPNIAKIFQFWRTLPKKKQPSGKSYEAVKTAVEDPLTSAKLSFFSYVASILQPFLAKYQTSKPMIPYLYIDLAKIYRSILGVIIKDDVLEKYLGFKLPEIDMDDEKNLKKEKDFTLGFVTEKMIKELRLKDAVTREQMDDFYENVKICIKTLIEKLNERSALTSVVLRGAVVFNPAKIVSASSKYLKKYLGLLLEHLVSLKIIKGANCDQLRAQYQSLQSDVETASIDLEDFPQTRLDDFFYKKMSIHRKYPELSEVVALILTLSHGNSDVERGFSLNKGVQKDNISEKSVVSKRHIKDYMYSNELKPYSVEITNELRKSCAQARSRYHQYLEDERKKKEKTSKDTAKEIISMEIEEVEGKISILQRSTDALNKKFEAIVMDSTKLPKSDDIYVALNEATALKRKANEQTDDIRKLEETVKVMQEKRSKM